MMKAIFERLDEWKQFPNYQLERRLDIFISLFIKELLESKLWPLQEIIIPEFPIARKTIGETDGPYKTVKVDYVLFPKDYKNPIVFLELKTDDGSVRESQISYLRKSKEATIEAILKDLEIVYKKSNSKPKYEYLFNKLNEVGLVDLKWSQGVKANQKPMPTLNPLNSSKIELILLAPSKPNLLEGFTCFDFIELSNILYKNKDELSVSLLKTLNQITRI